jgi:hypothetical protein
MVYLTETTMTTSAAPRWAQRLLASLDASDQRATDLARPLSVAQLNWRADQSTWSIGQCLDHLRVANEVYGPPITSALHGTGTGPVDEITPGWFGRWFIRTVIEPSPKTLKNQKAPAKIVPVAKVDATILDQFLKSNLKTRELIARARSFDVNRVRFKNPFVFWIRFTVGTGLEILARHEDRHLLQAERIRAHANFPTR